MSQSRFIRSKQLAPALLAAVALAAGAPACGGGGGDGDEDTGCTLDSCGPGFTCQLVEGICVADEVGVDVTDEPDISDEPDVAGEVDASDEPDAPDEGSEETTDAPADEEVDDLDCDGADCGGDVEDPCEDGSGADCGVDVEDPCEDGSGADCGVDVEDPCEEGSGEDCIPEVCPDGSDPPCTCFDGSVGDCADPGPEPPPQFNPWIAFEASAPPPFEGLDRVYVVRATGDDLTLIETGDLIQNDPAWSWDGRKLAFRGVSTEAPTLRVLDVTTGEVETIPHGLRQFTAIAFTPGDASVVVEGRADLEGKSDLFQIFLDGTTPMRNLTNTPDWSETVPRWIRRNQLIYGTNEPGGVSAPYHVELWDVYTGEKEQLSVSGDRLLGRATMSWALDRLLYSRQIGEGEAASTELVLLDFDPMGVEPPASSVIATPSARDAQVSLDGSFAVYVETAGQNDIIGYDITTNTVLFQPTDDARVESIPVISPAESTDVVLWTE